MSAQVKHTPRPWKTDHELGNQSVLGPDGVQVADCSITCNPKFGKRTDEINEANARLIASAPDLLKALDEAEDLLGFHEGSAEKMTETGHPVVWVNNEDLERVLKSIREAIAKAKGGAS